jgi:cyclopropane fatty-acyl-phospholipid synthase-like methyltransferase
MALPPGFDKYEYYGKSVQSTEADTEFFLSTYKELKKKTPKVFREDFCGTYELSRTWVKMNKNNVAYGIDLDPEPIAYGRKVEAKDLTAEQSSRVKISKKNVLAPDLPSADIIGSLNFSHYIFKDRKTMKTYFENCYDSLNKDGIFIVDCFGGSEAQEPTEERTNHGSYYYFWDQDSFDPVTNFAQFYIHFQIKGKRRIQKVFSYDWRIWSIPELRDLMEEVGFKKTHVYWEGTTRKGEGNGVFKRTETGEVCESWIAYVVGEK